MSNSSEEAQAVREQYSGSVGALWSVFLGEQLHLGGLASSVDLAAKAGIGAGMKGVDLCCGNGAAARLLVRMMGVEHMTGVDLTESNIRRGLRSCEEEGLADKVDLVVGDACETGLSSASMDFAWGEDAWCYVPDKGRLLGEAARLLKPGGTVAFTDWVEGGTALADEESDRILSFMKFPNMPGIEGYKGLLAENGFDVAVAQDTGRFVPCMELFQNMAMQFGYDAMKALDFDTEHMAEITEEMNFIRECAAANKIIQAVFVGRKES